MDKLPRRSKAPFAVLVGAATLVCLTGSPIASAGESAAVHGSAATGKGSVPSAVDAASDSTAASPDAALPMLTAATATGHGGAKSNGTSKLFSHAAKIADGDLSQVAGMADVSQSVVANNTSNVANNSVNGTSTTGLISFSSAAFQDLHGLAVISANTGNNVAINASLNVNVALQK